MDILISIKDSVVITCCTDTNHDMSVVSADQHVPIFHVLLLRTLLSYLKLAEIMLSSKNWAF